MRDGTPPAAWRCAAWGESTLQESRETSVRPKRRVWRAYGLLTFCGHVRKDSSHAFRVDVERQECQRHSARVSPLVDKTERFVDQRTRCLGLRPPFDRICARSRDDVIKRRS